MVLSAAPPTLAIPLRADEDGNIRVSGTRVTLDTLLAAYRRGDTPEAIHEGFPTVPLGAIYAVIAYYLAHTEEIDAYLQKNIEEAERARDEIEANYTPEKKARLAELRRLAEQKRGVES